MKARNHRVKEEVKKIRTLLSNPVNRELKFIKINIEEFLLLLMEFLRLWKKIVGLMVKLNFLLKFNKSFWRARIFLRNLWVK